MRKPFWSLLMIAGTAIAAIGMLAWTPSNPPTEARIVTVSRRDVHQVSALSGRLVYADERVAISPITGIVDRINVAKNQRVGEGEALIRLRSEEQEDILSAMLNHSTAVAALSSQSYRSDQIPVTETVIRAEAPSTIRQVLVAENAFVAAGTPVLRLSSNDQEIHCLAAQVDVTSIEPGMWAWISSETEAIGFARIASIGEPESDTQTGSTYVSVTLQPEQHIDLPEGAVVDVEVYIDGSDDVHALPLEAITPRETVWWVSDGRCTEISAEIVMTDEINAWVTLPEGMQVAIGEFEEGQRVVEELQ